MTDGVDLDLIKQHVTTIREKGGTRDDVKVYLDQVGVSPDQLLQHLEQPSVPQRVWGAVKGAASAVAETVTGKHDPAFKDVPGFNYQGITDVDTLSKIERAKLVTYDDKSYSDIIKKALGKRFIDSRTDANGYEVISYTDNFGETQKTYVNKPGLEYTDVDRAIASSAVFLATGGLAGAATRGAGALMRVGAQALTAAGTSVGADVAAGRMGSDQPIDLVRAGTTAGTAGLFEGLSRPVANLWRRIVTERRYVQNGQLTDAGRRQAVAAGLDPDEMDTRLAQTFGRDLSRAADVEEVAGKARMNEFGIVSTKGQRTKDPSQLGVEEEMRRGLLGSQAKETMSAIDEETTKSIEAAAFEKVGRRLAPEAPGRERATLGGSIKSGAANAKANLDDVEGRLWGEAGPMFPQEEGLAMLAPRITQEFRANHSWPKAPTLSEGGGIVHDANPQTTAMLQRLQQYAGDKIEGGVVPLIGKGRSSLFIDDVRRELLGMYKGAQRGSNDERLARHVYNGFNNWIDDLADNALLVGEPGVAARLKAARGFTKELKELFEPSGSPGRNAAATRIAKVMDTASSPEEALTGLGLGGPGHILPGQIEALRHMRKIMLGNGEVEAWDSIRMAHWAGIVTDRRGNPLSPKQMRNNIETMFNRQQSVLDILYPKEIQSMQKRLARALDDATFDPPNPSGTSYELERMRQRESGSRSLTKTFLETQSKRELFSKHNVLMSRIYGMMAKKMPINPLGAKEAFGATVARRAIDQGVTPTPPPSLGGYGGALGAQYDD